ncbi:stage II sporulation protein M [Anaerofustis sp.]|uniref:stage II sporulation protein M n=1 Tax=Anaerofustis sp. TaxID=1872517 RepID=UPI0025C127FD|nr:stage II sporulation protein M [Anaerofustis sp.]
MIREFINYHFKENRKKYLFFTFVFVLGLVVGGITIYFLTSQQTEELVGYISSFFSVLSKDTSGINSKDIFMTTLYRDLKLYVFLWILGLSALSLIYSVSVVFYKGFILGFTSTFFIYQFGLKGIVFAAVMLLVQNIIKTAALFFATVTASSFKFNVQKNNKNKYKQVNNSAFYIRYTIYIIIAFLLNILGIYIESYIVPMFMVVFSSAFL